MDRVLGIRHGHVYGRRADQRLDLPGTVLVVQAWLVRLPLDVDLLVRADGQDIDGQRVVVAEVDAQAPSHGLKLARYDVAVAVAVELLVDQPRHLLELHKLLASGMQWGI